MGHCRGAVVGDSLARLLEAAGFRVTKEYYVNDAGAQVDTLARSVHLRYREALGADIGEIPEGMYPGRLSVPVGERLAAEFGDNYAAAPEAEWLAAFRDAAIAAMLDLIRHDLGLLGIHHDKFASEAEVQAAGAVERALDVLRDKGLVYRRRARTAQEPRPARRMGAGRADPVPLDPVRRRPGPANQEIRRQLDLFWLRRRLSLAKGARRRPSGQHLGRRPFGHRQAGPGGGQSADRRPRRSRRQDRPDGPAVPRRRTGQDVQARRAIS